MTDVLNASDPPSVPTSKLLRIYRSPLGKKLITGITGLGLSLFAIAHMVGNLLLFLSRDAYNTYAYLLERSGPLLYGVELVLLVAVLFHAGLGIEIFVGRLKARRQGYQRYASAGKPSYQTLSSRTMIVTGSVLAVFLVTHLITFKYGPYYTTTLGSETVRDLSQLVIEKFHNLAYVLGYTAVVALLGFHLRHGLWSAVQSVGLLHRGVRPLVFALGTLVATAIALGFMVLPWAIYGGWVV